MRFNILKLCVVFAFLVGQIALAQERETSGTVTDESGAPLPGVNITVEGTTRGTQTDFDGNYSVNASNEETLVFSFVGFENQSVAIGNNLTIDVTITESASALDEVVVVGFGQEKKENLTGSVSSVGTEDISNRVSISPSFRLQGQVLGLRIVQS